MVVHVARSQTKRATLYLQSKVHDQSKICRWVSSMVELIIKLIIFTKESHKEGFPNSGHIVCLKCMFIT